MNGKGFDLKGKVEYELKNGNGYIKKFNKDNQLIFEGEILKGEINGKVKWYRNGL